MFTGANFIELMDMPVTELYEIACDVADAMKK